MRRVIRFLAGSAIGAGALAVFLWVVGVEQVVGRATAIAPWAVPVVVALVVAEGLADSLGVWASVNPLGRGLSAGQSVQFALAGDFFDTLSPAGPVSSEPIMARFISVTTETTYSEALGVRSVAKYVKSGTQLLVSTTIAGLLLFDAPSAHFVVTTLGGALAGLLLTGVVLVQSRATVSRVFVAAFAPLVAWVSSLYRETGHDRATVADAAERFWTRALRFRSEPALLGLIGVGGVLEQLLTAGALWVALAGTGTTAPYLVVVAVVPLPQAASAVPVPASIGAYDLLLAGVLVPITGAPATATTAAVLVVRTVSLTFRLSAGGLAVAFLRGWRPRP